MRPPSPTSGSGSVVDGHVRDCALPGRAPHDRSNYKLTLSGFSTPSPSARPSAATASCAGNEACDDGVNNGAYGTCMPGCTAARRCGDATRPGRPKKCDDGVNLATYGGTSKQCGPGCMWAPYCGDGKVSATAKQCDEGADNGTGYGHCTADCTARPALRRRRRQRPAKQCDDGINNGTANKCAADCKLKCGNGMVDPGEQCDDGAANEHRRLRQVQPRLHARPPLRRRHQERHRSLRRRQERRQLRHLQPRLHARGPAAATASCKPRPASSATRARSNSATRLRQGHLHHRCKPAPYCGDKAVDAAFGEKCDDGMNSGLPGSCTTDC